MPRSVSLRALALAVPLTAIIAALIAPGLAGAAVTPTGVTDTIHIEIVKGALKFVAPKTVTQGDELEIVNETNPKQVGPHTFSLVTKGSLPKTGRRARTASRRNTSASRSPNGTASTPKEEVDDQPGRSRPRRLEHDGQRDQEGRLLVHR